MLCLRSRTEAEWLERVIANTAEVLVDHAHCERKAASNALGLLARFPDRPELVAPLLALAREELEHFEAVVELLAARGIPLVAQPPSGYQAQLFALVGKAGGGRGGPGKLVDLLLVAALIEARSCERFRILAEQHPDGELRLVFKGLLESEARHHGVFVRLAEGAAAVGREAVRERLVELAEAERGILEGMAKVARIHA